MTPEELTPIVEAWGGVEKFAALLHVEPRTVERWLDGTRGIKPPVAKLIRVLEVIKS
jgi:DNA-binding transcriptional regulator YiaG